jgi:hypothetical protein
MGLDQRNRVLRKQMLALRIFRASIANPSKPLRACIPSYPGGLNPLFRTAFEAQAKVLGVSADRLSQHPRDTLSFRYDSAIDDAEILSDGTAIYPILLQTDAASGSSPRQHGKAESERIDIRLYYIGPSDGPSRVDELTALINRTFDCALEPYTFPSRRFAVLKQEGRDNPPLPTDAERVASQVLADRPTRHLAIAIKAAGGLLVRDLSKQLPAEARDRAPEIHRTLVEGAILESEFFISCSKTQSQVARVRTRETLALMKSEGVKCACGRPLAEERVEEAVSLTAPARSLLDHSRWLTVRVLDELARLGVGADHLLVEQQDGADEMDLIADLNGDLTLFELKDKEFNVGSAYSFSAKIGFIRPRHPIIVTTEHVGGDAREFFKKAVTARSRGAAFQDDSPSVADVRFIEGLPALRENLEKLMSSIAASDANQLLRELVPFGIMSFTSLLGSIAKSADAKAHAVAQSASS